MSEIFIHPRSAQYLRAPQNQFPMCSLQPLTYLQVQVLPRQWMVGPSSDSRLRLGETPAGASSAVNGRGCRRRRAVGGDWSAEAPKGFRREQEDKADFQPY